MCVTARECGRALESINCQVDSAFSESKRWKNDLIYRALMILSINFLTDPDIKLYYNFISKWKCIYNTFDSSIIYRLKYLTSEGEVHLTRLSDRPGDYLLIA